MKSYVLSPQISISDWNLWFRLSLDGFFFSTYLVLVISNLVISHPSV
jgi:hypothetical protein